MKHVSRRLAHGVLLLAALSFGAFAFAQLAPGDYFTNFGLDPNVSPETLEAWARTAGLRRPFLVRYGEWVYSALRGDFGYSLSYKGPVGPLLKERFFATLVLSSAATLLAWFIALPVGVWSGAHRRGIADAISNLAIALLLVTPDLLLAIAALLLAARTGWFPTGGMTSPGGDPASGMERLRDIAWHLALPALVLAIGMLPSIIRHVRAAMIEALDAPFALAARAHGIPSRRRLFRHVLPVAANPLITLMGVSLGSLLSGSLLVEWVMGWPGLGPLLIDAILARDIAVVVATVVLAGAFLIAGNLVADLVLYRVDPRIRAPR